MINVKGQLISGSTAEKRWLLGGLFLAALLVVIDQATKMIVVRHFRLGESMPIIPGCFSLTFVTNYGAAWGIMSGHGWLLLAISTAVFTFVIIRIRILTEGWRERYLAMFLILSGICGNSIDRLWRKAVIDFLDFFVGIHHWPAFNVADSAITVGVIIYILSVLLRPSLTAKAKGLPDSP